MARSNRVTSESELSASHTPRNHVQGLDGIYTIEIAKSRFYIERLIGRWQDESLPNKKGDPVRPDISIMIGPHRLKAICDHGASVNIIPMAIYDDVLQFGSRIYTTMHVRHTDHSTRRVEGIADDICVLIGNSYVAVDFVVLNTRRDPEASIILGRPFLRTAKGTIYAATSDICFHINGKERFSFKTRFHNRYRIKTPNARYRGAASRLVNPETTRAAEARAWELRLSLFPPFGTLHRHRPGEGREQT